MIPNNLFNIIIPQFIEEKESGLPGLYFFINLKEMLKKLIILAWLFHISALLICGLPRLSDPGFADSYLARADILYERSDYDSLPWYYTEALKISSGLNDTTNIIRCYLGFAEYYRLISDFPEALEWLEKARTFIAVMTQPHNELEAYMDYIKGKILAGKGEYNEALKFIRKAAESEGSKDHRKNSRYLNYIGNIYYMTGDSDTAEYYFRESFREINLETDGPAVEKSWYYINISKIYRDHL